MAVFIMPDLDMKNALSLHNDLEKIVPEEKMGFDFSKMSNFDPFAMLIAGSIIQNFRKKFSDIDFYIEGYENKSYAGTMGFFKYISPKIKFGKMPGEAYGSSNYIPITKIEVDELLRNEIDKGNFAEMGEVIEIESSRLASIIDRGNEELHILLTYLIREVMRNTPEHSESQKLWICGQFWPKYDLAEIAFLDEGIGIYKSIVKNRMHKQCVSSNLEALKLAMKAGISNTFNPRRGNKKTGTWSNSGFGLYMVSQICKKLEGNFCIASDRNYLIMNREGFFQGESMVNGTAIKIRVPIRNIHKASELITEILQNGEKEARIIRNAFKKASKPSKGILKLDEH